MRRWMGLRNHLNVCHARVLAKTQKMMMTLNRLDGFPCKAMDKKNPPENHFRGKAV